MSVSTNKIDELLRCKILVVPFATCSKLFFIADIMSAYISNAITSGKAVIIAYTVGSSRVKSINCLIESKSIVRIMKNRVHKESSLKIFLFV